MLSFVILSLIVELNENGIGDQLEIQHWNDWNRNQGSQKTIHQNHESILNLQNEIIKSFTLENYNWNYKWKHDDTDWKEGNGDTSVQLIIAIGIFQFDNVHSSEGIKISPDKLVSVNEHSNQEAKKQHIE